MDPAKARGGFRECHPTPLFDQDKVHDSFKAILTKQSYQQNMKKLQMLASQHGGRKLAADTVERVAKTGVDYLIDHDFYKKQKKVSCCTNIFLYLVLIAMVAYITINVIKQNGN